MKITTKPATGLTLLPATFWQHTMAFFKSISFKLSLAFTVAVILVVVTVVVVSRISMNRTFLHHIEERTKRDVQRVAYLALEVYQQNRSWAAFRQNPQHWESLLRRSLTPPDRMRYKNSMPAGTPPEPPQGFYRTDREANRNPHPRARQYDMSLWDAERKWIAGSGEQGDNITFYAIKLNGQPIGYISYLVPDLASYQLDRRFLQQQLHNSLWIAGSAIIIALVIILPLANRWTKPIIRLSDATRLMRSGNYQSQVPVDTADEIGQLSNHFNALAKTLEANEIARKQWVADISHELRTPLAVLKAQVEALIDGVRPSSGENLSRLLDKVDELSHLIDDLYQLSLSDLGALNYRREDIKLHPLLERLIASSTTAFEQTGLTLRSKLEVNADTTIYADEKRLLQLLNNLLQNSLKYTEAPGTVLLRAATTNTTLTITLEDSPPAPPTAEFSKLFDRLYRVEASRNRQTGGAGLGLAICKNIVDAHGGDINASLSSLGGLQITVQLPLKD